MAGRLGRLFDTIFIPTDLREASRLSDMHPEPGALFQSRHAGRVPEFARVIECATDGLGVSHVRFELSYCYQDREARAGERTLALAAFNARFELARDA